MRRPVFETESVDAPKPVADNRVDNITNGSEPKSTRSNVAKELNPVGSKNSTDR
jgi:hypothetical protein